MNHKSSITKPNIVALTLITDNCQSFSHIQNDICTLYARINRQRYVIPLSYGLTCIDYKNNT